MISFIFDFIVSPSNISGQNWTSSGCVLLFGSFDLYRNFELVVERWMQTAIPVDVTFWLLGFPFACKSNQSERTVLHGRRSRFSPFDFYKQISNHCSETRRAGRGAGTVKFCRDLTKHCGSRLAIRGPISFRIQVQPKRTHSVTWAALSFLSVRLLQTLWNHCSKSQRAGRGAGTVKFCRDWTKHWGSRLAIRRPGR